MDAFLQESQDGFRQKRGTVSTALIESNAILNSGRRAIAIATFVDYADTFSSVAHNFLDEALGKADVSGKLRRLVRAVCAPGVGKRPLSPLLLLSAYLRPTSAHA